MTTLPQAQKQLKQLTQALIATKNLQKNLPRRIKEHQAEIERLTGELAEAETKLTQPLENYKRTWNQRYNRFEYRDKKARNVQYLSDTLLREVTSLKDAQRLKAENIYAQHIEDYERDIANARELVRILEKKPVKAKRPKKEAPPIIHAAPTTTKQLEKALTGTKGQWLNVQKGELAAIVPLDILKTIAKEFPKQACHLELIPQEPTPVLKVDYEKGRCNLIGQNYKANYTLKLEWLQNRF